MTEPQNDNESRHGTGAVRAIWIKRSKNGPMDERPRAQMVAGRGLADNANQGGKRQVTILSADAWQRVDSDLGATVDPRLRRANLFVDGVELAHSRGRTLRLGECRVLVRGETRPCRKMEESWPGLQKALDPEWRGGVYGEVLVDGEIAVGDPVVWESE